MFYSEHIFVKKILLRSERSVQILNEFSSEQSILTFLRIVRFRVERKFNVQMERISFNFVSFLKTR